MLKAAKRREPVGEAGLFDYAVGALARRMRTERELRTLMRGRAHEGEAGERDIDRVVERLKEARYLSDERFAEAFTRIRKDGRGLGRRRVAQDLAAKGVGKELATATVAAAYDEEDEVALVRGFCERKRMKAPANQKEAVRMMNRLLRAGYSGGAIGKVLRGWRVEVPAEGLEEVDGEGRLGQV